MIMLSKIIRHKRNSLVPVVLENVGFQKRGRWLLQDISCRMASHNITAIMGPNGAGKSLLLQILHGLLSASCGTITAGGKPITFAHDLPTAISLQNPILLRRSVADNLKAALKASSPQAPNKETVKETIETLLQWGQLHELQNQSARLLSGGERQALCLLRALVSRPQILLLDEPCANLDPQATRKVENLITDAAKHKVKICLITHDVAQAKRLADEVVFIHKGRLCELTSGAQFFKKPQSKQAAHYLQGKLLV